MSEAGSVYTLDGTLEDCRLWLVAPGYSSEDYDRYRVQIEGQDFVLAVNSALEFTTPDLWMWSDKSFANLYRQEIYEGTPRAMACPGHQTKMEQWYPGSLWFFHYQMKLRAWEEIVTGKRVEGKPFWYSPTRQYLPGRASVVNNAVSLAWLLRPRVCVLVGVDWQLSEDRYYRSDILKNKGPTDRERALNAGLSFFELGIRRSLWEGLDLATISDSGIPAKGVRRLSWEEALHA